MKFTAGIIAALASCSAATTTTGQAFIFPRDGSASTATLNRSLARLVFLQRLANPGEGPSIRDIPEGISADEAVATLNKFSNAKSALFASEPTTKRLLVMVDGMTAQQIDEAEKALDQSAAFTIDDLPSSTANRDLFEIDAYNAGATKQHRCSLGEIVDMKESKCWSETSTAARFNVAEKPNSMKSIVDALRSIPKLAKAGEVEATIVLLPATGDNAKPSWSDKPQELRRRQAEQVISSNHKAALLSETRPSTTSSSLPVEKTPIPACFTSNETCIAGTNNCSGGHGSCVNKYGAVPENPKEGDVCFVCRCKSTANKNSGPTHWGGPTCAKEDVSVPFWLFFGFTIVLVSVVWMAIGLLFSVGEEKLPGVIGAGVSRSK
ncbi:hypothetical protein ISF_05130 [Cordyceps fumosorosea ARSEF 2679]|uniref:Vacuolar sorting protein Vps3844 C-terminal domain-containing protein n=1 Tax=Cordyceps fumosorosea (strain ARSEF 2679) TaxID=1081104 RepID=A0A167V1G5_CORFA|nr:hypothetical protein ISF_05130 [Cordyceps fumosorosea ARSEF 2679]OAA62121.1 hypothetical protein ISF_05130 [Cordyceps fumosorosea ARSEF 2679]